ncbi:hypothetical protein KDL29_15085 [bacterium]|nr:hypothetical protein [bacterium]
MPLQHRAIGSLLAIAFLCVSAIACGRSPGRIDNNTVERPGLQQAAAAPDPAVMQQLRSELERVLAQRGIELDDTGQPLRSVSAIPKLVYRQPGWFSDFNGDTALAWAHYQQGDYDLNGEVNISDLTPVGIHLGKTTASPDWLTAAVVADGDGNGEINIADVTPIGQNFAARVSGYMVQAREASGEWHEVGFTPMESGFKSGPGLEMGYFANGGEVEADWRVAPVAGVREFSWNRYALTTQDFQHFDVQGCIVDGRPALVYERYGLTPDTHDGFAIAAVARPQSAADWYLEDDLGHFLYDNSPVAIASVDGKPAIAYVDYSAAPVSFAVMYSRRDSAVAGPAGWSTHQVASLSANPVRLALTVREGRPYIQFNNSGLEAWQANTAQPSGPADWSGYSAAPGFNDFRSPQCIASGPWLFSCGLGVTPAPYLLFNRSTVLAPNGSGSFSDYLLTPVDSAYPPRLMLIAGLPCVVVSDATSSSLQFLQAGSRTSASAASWFQHTIVAQPGSDLHWEPAAALVGGRPAVASGYNELRLYWTGGQFPDNSDQWSSQPVDDSAEPFDRVLLALDGLPLVLELGSASGNSQVVVNIGNEQ